MVRLERTWREGYTMRVCIFRVRSTLLAGCCMVYLNFGIFRIEYTLRVCIFFVSYGVIISHGMHGAHGIFFATRFFFVEYALSPLRGFGWWVLYRGLTPPSVFCRPYGTVFYFHESFSPTDCTD